jgi:hypothetical protein
LTGKFEIKYLTSINNGIRFINGLTGFLDYDRHSKASKRYVVRSLYFDTPDFRNYHAKIDGIQVRKKFRLRYYSLKDEKVFFEVKHKFDRIVIKDRQTMLLSDAMKFFKTPFDMNTYPNISCYAFELSQVTHYPTVTVCYERVAMEEAFSKKVRVTLDFNIRCGKKEMFNRPVTANDLRVLPPGLAVIEIKFIEKLPSWLNKRICKFEMSHTSYSKYCNAIDRVYNKKMLI